MRERRSTGELVGIFIDDRRDANERGTYLAERGQVVENDGASYLILRNGSAQRLQTKSPDPTIIVFDQYAFDLSQFNAAEQTGVRSAPERYIWELARMDPNDPLMRSNPRRVFTELHDRLLAPLFPLTFCIISFAILGAPRTSRQSRTASMVLAILAVIGLRLVCFAVLIFAVRQPSLVYAAYGAVALNCAVGLLMISRGTIVEAPALLTNALAGVQARFSRPAGATA